MATRIISRSLLTKISSPVAVGLRSLTAAVHFQGGSPLPAAAAAAAVRVRSFATRTTSSSLNDPNPNWSNRPPKETILLDGCDFEHWLIVLEKPEGDPTRDEIIDTYIKTLAMVVGSEEEARMKIYSVSTKHYFAFGALVSEELSYKIKELPKVRWVLPDSYLDVKNKDYGGEPFINGQAVPYDPKYHEEWVRNNARAQDRNRRNDRPRNNDRSRNFERRRENMQNRDVDHRGPSPPNTLPPQNSTSVAGPNMSPPTGNYPPHNAPQNHLPRDNYSAQPFQGNVPRNNFPPHNAPQNNMPIDAYPAQPPHGHVPQNNFPPQNSYPTSPQSNYPAHNSYTPHNSYPPPNNMGNFPRPATSNFTPQNTNSFPQQSYMTPPQYQNVGAGSYSPNIQNGDFSGRPQASPVPNGNNESSGPGSGGPPSVKPY
ncbi:unnamed protein product [Rhodiola kirilowii]